MTDIPSRLQAALQDRYHLQRELGAGGMATVYLARDLKHDRQVAIKVLRPELAAVIGAERFLVEIKTTANLQHPHILPLFDSGEADGFLYYVMPFIDGESLREYLDREKQLGVEEAVQIARDVGDALEYAHGQGVIHRDIKPANILLHRGRPMVADFGIAVAISAAGGGRMTETGLSLGTPHYMSPEQASADRDLSARSDVYSLGCVLYEMLAGQPPHTGPSAQSVLVRIMTEAPRRLTELRHTVPPHVASAVAKAIEKLPADRFDSAQGMIDALDDPSFAYTPEAPTPAAGTAPPSPPPAAPGRGRRGALSLIATAAVSLVAGFAVASLLPTEPDPAPSAAFSILPDTSHTIISVCCGRAVAISPAGDRIVYQGFLGGGSEDGLFLFQRSLDQEEASLIPGTVAARHPFFSPDGEWVGYFAKGQMWKVRFDGGAPLPVAPIEARPYGATWGSDGNIVFSQSPGELWSVSADGGLVERVAEVDSAGGVRFLWPHLLPDDRTVLVTVPLNQGEGGEWRIDAVDLGSGERTPLVPGGADPRFVEPGYLIYADGAGSIMAQPFDPGRVESTGERFRITDGATFRDEGQSEYDISRNGTLIFRSGGEAGTDTRLTVVDRSGQGEPLEMAGGLISGPRFSPDGRYLAAEIREPGASHDIFVWDMERSNQVRVTYEGDNRYPSWAPSGEHLLFQRIAGDTSAAYSKAPDGTGPVQRVIDAVGRTPEYSPDGRWLVWTSENRPNEGTRIWYKPTDGSGEERPLIGSDFPEFGPAISPDGRWIAYVSQDDGDDQVYVQSFPELGPRFKVSPQEGGREPRWSRDGSELFYQDYDTGDLMAVEVRAGDSFDVGEYTRLFPTLSHHVTGVSATNWDVHPDGERFVFELGETTGGGVHRTRVITNAVQRVR